MLVVTTAAVAALSLVTAVLNLAAAPAPLFCSCTATVRQVNSVAVAAVAAVAAVVAVVAVVIAVVIAVADVTVVVAVVVFSYPQAVSHKRCATNHQQPNG